MQNHTNGSRLREVAETHARPIANLRPTPVALAALVAAVGCQSGSSSVTETTTMTPTATVDVRVTPAAAAYVVDVRAEEYAFDAPDQIKSGWVTFRMENAGEETHFLTVSRLPDDHTYDDFTIMIVKREPVEK